ncbi:MAG: SIMPL domain-containing protein [Spirochaetota bacterium]|nr:SIMPL domain-containing protein [Spirochaetota bacterium]
MIKKLLDIKILLSISIIFASSISALILGNAIIKFKTLDRSVTVKGLSEREYPADIVIWPIGFSETANNLTILYNTLDNNKNIITNFLIKKGLSIDEISISSPQITDRQTLTYNDSTSAFRYIAKQYITIRSTNISFIQQLMSDLPELGKKEIVFLDKNYDNPIQYTFSKLNSIKPEMIEESTKEARTVAMKFATDSQSKLGKIKNASQGQFTIRDRDFNNPHIKLIRVVSTIEYYLSD